MMSAQLLALYREARALGFGRAEARRLVLILVAMIRAESVRGVA